MPGTRTSPTNSAAVSRNSLGYLSRPNQRIRGASRGLGMIDSRLAGEDDVGAHHATTGRMYGVDSSWRQFRAVAGKLHSGRGCWNCRAHKSGTSRSEEHPSELQSPMRSSYDVYCLQKKTQQ